MMSRCHGAKVKERRCKLILCCELFGIECLGYFSKGNISERMITMPTAILYQLRELEKFWVLSADMTPCFVKHQLLNL